MTDTLTPLEALEELLLAAHQNPADRDQAERSNRNYETIRAALTGEAVAWTDTESLARLRNGNPGHIFPNRSERASLTIPLFTSPPDQSERIAELEKRVEEQRVELSEYRSSTAYSDLYRDYQQAGAKIAELEKEVERLTKYVSTLENDRASCANVLAQANGEIEDLNKENADLRARLAKAVELLRDLSSQIRPDLLGLLSDDMMFEISVHHPRAAAQFVKANSEAGQ